RELVGVAGESEATARALRDDETPLDVIERLDHPMGVLDPVCILDFVRRASVRDDRDRRQYGERKPEADVQTKARRGRSLPRGDDSPHLVTSPPQTQRPPPRASPPERLHPAPGTRKALSASAPLPVEEAPPGPRLPPRAPKKGPPGPPRPPRHAGSPRARRTRLRRGAGGRTRRPCRARPPRS